ncbi:NAD(P)/FAD-dependent oxidoreductase [Cryomorphaceae bacterium 1068]|nr:NAD(P)/FAD-dependent oxidoreductase [Cryomorphaceae bacterium 1068]
MKTALVIGGGLVGSLHAANLARRGLKVKVIERRPDLRGVELQAGKSINLALSTRGWKALDMIGVSEKVREVAIPMYGRRIHDPEGNVSFQSYGKEGQAIYSVSRGELNCVLLDAAESYDGVEMRFNCKCTGVDFEKSIAYFQDYKTGEEFEEKADLIFGTDGAFSAVRADMQKTQRFNYQQEFIPHGYRELLLPANDDGTYAMDKNALHIWPRGGYMLIALPNPDGSFTCTLFMPYEGENSFANLDSDEAIDAFFKKQFPDFYAMMPDLVGDYKSHPLSDLVIIRCYPWVRENTCLMGDSSHAIVPFYGQGMNSGFEDCSVMDELFEKHNEDWEATMNAFQKMRKPDADAIAELAMRNYVEMRDSVADPTFILRKKIEANLHEHHGEKWIPLYSQVTFSHIRYSEALAEGKKHDRIMEAVMDKADISSRWNSPEIEQEALALAGIR